MNIIYYWTDILFIFRIV